MLEFRALQYGAGNKYVLVVVLAFGLQYKAVVEKSLTHALAVVTLYRNLSRFPPVLSSRE